MEVILGLSRHDWVAQLVLAKAVYVVFFSLLSFFFPSISFSFSLLRLSLFLCSVLLPFLFSFSLLPPSFLLHSFPILHSLSLPSPFPPPFMYMNDTDAIQTTIAVIDNVLDHLSSPPGPSKISYARADAIACFSTRLLY